MTVSLRVVLDQLVAPTIDDVAAASAGLANALVAAAPSGCDVAAIVPAATPEQLATLDAQVPGLADVHRVPLARRELAAAWQLSAKPGVGGGMIHAPSLLAPLARHDRLHDRDQTVVTLWDLDAWESPDELGRTAVAWQRGMLRRAARHADAIVVPTHAMAARLADIARVGERIRVIAGATTPDFARPRDTVGRLRALSLPDEYVLVDASTAPSTRLELGLGAAERALAADPALHVVVVGAAEGTEPAILDAAAGAGIPERRAHVRGPLDRHDRAAVVGEARAFVAPSRRSAFPWRVLEALELGVPVVAAASPVHAEVILDGGLVVGDPQGETDADELGAALVRAVADADVAARLRVLAADRAKAFSWREAAERVWQLHADL